MTKEQAMNYLRSSGFSSEQIKEIVKAFEPSKHIIKSTKMAGYYKGLKDVEKYIKALGTEPVKPDLILNIIECLESEERCKT